MLERIRAETEEITVRNENSRNQSASEIRDSDERRAASLRNDEKRTDAEVAGQEADRQDTRLERRVFLGVTMLGFIVAAILVFLTVGQSGLEHRLSPGVGLLISGGAGLRLRTIKPGKPARSSKRKKIGKRGAERFARELEAKLPG